MKPSDFKLVILLRSIGCIIVYFAAFSAAAETTINCRRLVTSQYCFGDGSFSDLMPSEALHAEMKRHHDQLVTARSKPSRLTPLQRARYTRAWKAAMGEAHEYARAHFLTLDVLEDDTPLEYSGESPLDAVFGAFHEGPIARMTFTQAADGVFLLDRPVELHVPRLLQGIDLIRGALGLQGRLLLEPYLFRPLNQLRAANFSQDFVPFPDLVESMGLTAHLIQLQALSERAEVSWLAMLGPELLLALYATLDEDLRERFIALDHEVHFFDDEGMEDLHLKSPQVTFQGTLLLPDSASENFTDDEIRLLMKHEAMHLMRPNFFMLLGAADEAIRLRFPQIDMNKSNTFLASFLGHETAGDRASCALDIAKDDEMFIDYSVLNMLKADMDRVDDYYRLLVKLRNDFDKRSVSQMTFRVELAAYVVDTLKSPRPTADATLENQLLWRGIWSWVRKGAPAYLLGERPRMDDLLGELSRYPELETDIEIIRRIIQYYQVNSEKKGDHRHIAVGLGNMTCSRLGDMLRTRMR